uniref:Pentacotripeptide-repeat region of PRORP domain-containing protein n=1 Tax=Oryza nivara TaxID=4536 RepID=A0A0E0IXT3_ORYNI
MESTGCPQSTITYDTIIDGLCKTMRIEEAKEVFDQMDLQGISRNAITFNTPIDGLCKAKRIDDAFELINQMISEGLQPNNITYNSILTHYCKDEAYSKSLQSAIQSLFRRNDIRDALSLFREITEVGEPPDAFTYKIVFRGLCCGGGPINEAFDFHMVDKGFIPEFSSFRMLAEGLLHLGMDDYFIRAIEIIIEKTDLRDSDVSAIREYLKIRKFYYALATFGRLLEINNHQWKKNF